MSQPTPQGPPPPPVVITKYLIGESTPEEAVSVLQWIGNDPEKQSAMAALRVWWSTRLETTNHDQVESALEMAMRRAHIASMPTSTSHDQHPAPQSRVFPQGGGISVNGKAIAAARRPYARWYALASFVVGAVLVGAGWEWGRSLIEARSTAVPKLYATTYVTGRGERLAVALPDGSTVYLNVASRIDIPDDYLRGNRTVRLSGEALFTVNHQSNAPFSVIAGSTHARVLGTSFIVRRYDTDTAVTVAVRDGKVAVGETVLTAQQRVVAGIGGLSRVLPASMGQFDFASGLLTLDNVRLDEAVNELSRWYDADIRLGTTMLSRRHIKGQFKTESLADLATILEFSHDLRVVRDGRTLTLYPNPKE